MEALSELKQKERTFKLLTNFVQILNAISAVRFKRFKEQVYRTLPYHRHLEELISQLYSFYPVEKITSLFRKVKSPQAVDFVFFFSSRGFVGDFNQRMELSLLKLRERTNTKTYTIVVGNKAKNLLKRKIADFWFPSPLDTRGYLKEEILKKLTNFLVERFENEETDKVVLVYFTPSLKGVDDVRFPKGGLKIYETSREESLEIFYEPEEVLKEIKISPGGSYRIRLTEFLPPKIKKVKSTSVVNIEGNERELIEKLLNFYIRFSLRFVLLEHLASETIARLNTTSSILQRTKEKLKEIRLKILKKRAELITEELNFLSTHLIEFERFEKFPYFGDGEEKILFLQKDWIAKNRLKEIFKPNTTVYWDKLGFAFLRINKNPNFLKPSYYLDSSVEGILEQFLKEFGF